MAKPKRIFTVQDATGTADELHAWITAGVENPPSLVAFTRRLKRGERNPAELRRSPGRFSAASIEARTSGLKKWQEQRRQKLAINEPVIRESTPFSAPFSETSDPNQGPIKLVYGQAYFRPGSMEAFPELRKVMERR